MGSEKSIAVTEKKLFVPCFIRSLQSFLECFNTQVRLDSINIQSHSSLAIRGVRFQGPSAESENPLIIDGPCPQKMHNI
jgi:hypothetical protein